MLRNTAAGGFIIFAASPLQVDYLSSDVETLESSSEPFQTNLFSSPVRSTESRTTELGRSTPNAGVRVSADTKHVPRCLEQGMRLHTTSLDDGRVFMLSSTNIAWPPAKESLVHDRLLPIKSTPTRSDEQ